MLCDMSFQTAFTLSVRQSEAVVEKKSQLDDETMIDHYMDHIRAVHPYLHENEKKLALDGALVVG